jgi:hypothetical protein
MAIGLGHLPANTKRDALQWVRTQPIRHQACQVPAYAGYTFHMLRKSRREADAGGRSSFSGGGRAIACPLRIRLKRQGVGWAEREGKGFGHGPGMILRLANFFQPWRDIKPAYFTHRTQ